MMKKSTYCILLTSLLLAAACSTHGTAPETEAGIGTYREIRICTSAPELKSLVDPATDMIYAYTFDSEHNFSWTGPSSIENGIYTYSVSGDLQFMVFSNISPENPATEVRSDADIMLALTPRYLTDEDMVTGTATADMIPEDGSALNIHLNRITSKVTAELTIKTPEGELLDLTGFMRTASISLSPQSASYIIKGDYSAGYEESTTFTLTGGVLEESATSYQICNDMSVLPTMTQVSETTDLTLTLTDSEGQETAMTKNLGYALEPNKHYKLSISVTHDDTGFGFRIDDIITEDIEINLN